MALMYERSRVCYAIKELMPVYKAATEKKGLENLEAFLEKWDKKYPYISKSWKTNWSELSTFFQYRPEIRKLIYTTNPIESFNRGIRKVAKNRSFFQNEESIFKLFYLTRDI
jgi:transposase-like protein